MHRSHLTRAAIAASFLLGLAGTAIAQDAPWKEVETEIGTVWANADGMTLYTYDKDSQGVSNCYDKCAANWPPFAAENGAEVMDEWTIVERKDGTKQWAYEGKPLYLWVKDQKPGDTTGEGVGGVWHAAKAD